MKTLKLIVVVWLLLGFQKVFSQIQVAKYEIHRDTLKVKNSDEYFGMNVKPILENIDLLWGKSCKFQKNHNIYLKKIPQNNSFLLSFWISIPEKREGIRTSVIMHSNKSNPNDFIELYIDGENYIHFNRSKNGNEPGKEEKSKQALEPKTWYYITYEYNSKSAKFSLSGMTSKRYRFNAFYAFRTSDGLFSIFKNSDKRYQSEIYGNSFKLYKYSETRNNKLEIEFNQEIQKELFNYYKTINKAPSFKERELKYEKDSVVINTREFELKLWDSQDVDGDVINVYSESGFYFQGARAKYQLTGRDVEIKEALKPEFITIKFPDDSDEGTLIFAAKDMGTIRDFNTAKIQVINGDKEEWVELEVNPTLDANRGIRFVYNPNAQPPDEKYDYKDKSQKEELDDKSTKTQKVMLRISDYSIKDGDILTIKINDQPEIIRKLKKEDENIPIVLDQQNNKITFESNKTKLFNCTAKVDLLELEGRSPSRRISSEKMSISKKMTKIKEIKFQPRQYKEHELIVFDDEIKISVSDPQKVDGDSLKIVMEGGNSALLENTELTDRPKVFNISMGQDDKVLKFIPTSKGTDIHAANLCKVSISAIRNKKRVIIAEYIMQMPKVNDPGILVLKKK